MPVVNPELVTEADNLKHKCPKCGKRFKDFILFLCTECEKKGCYKITLNPEWFSEKLEDGSPDWNSVKKDKAQFTNEWSYGRLNINTLQMEQVPINRDGKKWDYLDYSISTAEEDKKIENAALQKAKTVKSAKEIKQEIKYEKDIQKREKEADKEERELTEEKTSEDTTTKK